MGGGDGGEEAVSRVHDFLALWLVEMEETMDNGKVKRRKVKILDPTYQKKKKNHVFPFLPFSPPLFNFGSSWQPAANGHISN